MHSRVDQPDIEVRSAVPAEADAIASVLLRAFIEYEPLYTPGGFAATTPAAERIRQRWDEGPVWVALAGGLVVGTVAAVPQQQALYVRSMAIVPEARGRGIGRLLLGRVEAFARAHGFARMTLTTTPFLHNAIALYERYGFQRSDRGPIDLHGTPLFEMEKSLPAETTS